MAPRFVLGYWDIRGLAAPARLLLEYIGEPWEDKIYVTGPAPTFDKSGYFNEKFNLGLDFPNLPYLFDSEANVKLSQTHCILRYLARKGDLLGSTDEELSRMELAEFQQIDLRKEFADLGYNPNFESLKATYLTNLKEKLGMWSKFLGSRTWIAGEKLTFVDFSFFDLLDQMLVLDSTILEPFQNLQDYVKRFANLPKIEAYMKSDRYIKYPLNNRMAKFGG